jgi:hypothetical protein
VIIDVPRERDKRPIIRFYNSDLLPGGALARIISVDLAIMPKAESELEKRVIRALEDYYALDFEHLLEVPRGSESKLGHALEVTKNKQIIDW